MQGKFTKEARFCEENGIFEQIYKANGVFQLGRGLAVQAQLIYILSRNPHKRSFYARSIVHIRNLAANGKTRGE